VLILGRREGQWVTVVHNASGDTLRIRLFHVRGRSRGDAPRCQLGFDDPDWRFLIDRPQPKSVDPSEDPGPGVVNSLANNLAPQSEESLTPTP